MRGLVTGCARFIISTLVDRLVEKDILVVGVDCFNDYYSRSIKENNLSSALQSSKFKFMEKDIYSMDSFPDVDYVFYQAAQASVRAS
ncbi:MAG: hypothetical protein QG610_42 [Euryarchaeota archaeon]|nr:hypothetical protein [Euryarchaeota archaeon]